MEVLQFSVHEHVSKGSSLVDCENSQMQ